MAEPHPPGYDLGDGVRLFPRPRRFGTAADHKPWQYAFSAFAGMTSGGVGWILSVGGLVRQAVGEAEPVAFGVPLDEQVEVDQAASILACHYRIALVYLAR